MQDENQLQDILIARIDREGPMTFRNFMDAALYDRDHGYYVTERPKIGGAGDYYTSSNIRPLFGATLAQAFADLWSDHTGGLDIMEVGAGGGQLAFDLLTAMRDRHESLFNDLAYIITDVSPAMRERQRSMLTEFNDKVAWVDPTREPRRSAEGRTDSKPSMRPIRGIVFSNELIDAMPVHRVRLRRRALEEQYVTVSAKMGLELDWGPVSNSRLSNYVTRMGATLEEEQVIEICLDAIDWLDWVSAAIVDGYLVTVDYGDRAERLYIPERRNGTLRCFQRYRLSDDPLAQIGEQDITASVNFTALIEYGLDTGLEFVSLETQREFLIRMGFLEALASLSDRKARLIAKNLIVPGGISDGFHVLIQRVSTPSGCERVSRSNVPSPQIRSGY
jgi:SAM-dependent MidA family methyltransferase